MLISTVICAVTGFPAAWGCSASLCPRPCCWKPCSFWWGGGGRGAPWSCLLRPHSPPFPMGADREGTGTQLLAEGRGSAVVGRGAEVWLRGAGRAGQLGGAQAALLLREPTWARLAPSAGVMVSPLGRAPCHLTPSCLPGLPHCGYGCGEHRGLSGAYNPPSSARGTARPVALAWLSIAPPGV